MMQPRLPSAEFVASIPWNCGDRAAVASRQQGGLSPQDATRRQSRHRPGVRQQPDARRRSVGQRIGVLAQTSGVEFTYGVFANNVLPAGRQRQLHKGNFARAHARMPLRATTDIKDVQGSSYVFAIVTDQRIGGNP